MRCSTWFAGYLLGEQAGNRKALEPLDPLVVAGKKYFQELNCAACHAVAGIPAAAPIASLKNADPTRGCLSKTSGKHPQFHLQDVQIQAITAAIKEEPQAEADAVQIAKTLTTFNCIACHMRDDYGGVPEEYDPFYLTSEKNLGDDGRIPPPLTLVGYRGIAVGLPEKISYAFNAETGTLSALWQGDFVGVNWNGQGSGDFNPAKEPITLAQDASFAQLEDENSPWPVMTKDARVNPDPLYPKNIAISFEATSLMNPRSPRSCIEAVRLRSKIDRRLPVLTNSSG